MAGKRVLPGIDGPFLRKRVLVVGRGPLGLFTALALAQNGALVTLMGRDPLGIGVAFENAAGLIEPVATSEVRAARWMRETMDFCAWAADDPAWGIVPRRVLFMSDEPDSVSGGWLDEVAATPASPVDLCGVRNHGAWFGSYVIQPDLSLEAFRRELGTFGMDRTWSVEKITRDREFKWVDDVAGLAARMDADFFVLAPGISLGRFGDIDGLVGRQAGLSAGMGLTIEIPNEEFDEALEHVIMDFDDLAYLIPQKTRVIAGGTNFKFDLTDPIAKPGGHPMLNTEWEGMVRDNLDRILPGAGDLKGEAKVAPRPMRSSVLTHWTEDHDPPGFILGGAGGSGWTFSVGIAHDVCRVARARLGGEGPIGALGSGQPLVEPAATAS